MISIKILEPKALNTPKNAFVATCVAMFGDGDEFKDITLAPIHKVPGHETELEELIQLLDAMEKFHWIADNEYADLTNFAKWFNPEGNTDPFLDENGFIATLYSYEITYFDHEGIAHKTSIEV